MYEKLMEMSGEPCYTLTFDKEATMDVNENEVLITYPTGRKLPIPRQMVKEAINALEKEGSLSAKDIYDRITKHNRPRTDKLMAVLRKLPGVTFKKRPRVLCYSEAASDVT